MSEKNDHSRGQKMQSEGAPGQGNILLAGAQDFFGQFALAWRLLLDGRVPFLTKIVPLLSAFYVLWPIDFVPGLIAPGLGQLDDLAVFLVGLRLFIELCPPDLVEELKSGRLPKRGWTPTSGPVIDLEARVPSDDEDEEGPF